jgi:uncharacterized membrane protein
MRDLTAALPPSEFGARLLWTIRRVPAQVAIVLMSVAGMGIATYLTFEHYHTGALVCNVNSVINCSSVLTSPYSVMPGTQIPITFPGLLWFLVMGGMAVVAISATWRNVAAPKNLLMVQRVWGGLGLLSILYLVYAEIVKIHRLCEWCTGVHILILATFLTLLALPAAAPAPVVIRKPKANAAKPKVNGNGAAAAPAENTPATDGTAMPTKSANGTTKSPTTPKSSAAIKPATPKSGTAKTPVASGTRAGSASKPIAHSTASKQRSSSQRGR